MVTLCICVLLTEVPPAAKLNTQHNEAGSVFLCRYILSIYLNSKAHLILSAIAVTTSRNGKTITAYGGREVELHVSLTSALMKANSQFHAPAALNQGNTAELRDGRLGRFQTRSGLYKGKTKALVLPANRISIPRLFSPQTGHYTNWAMQENFIWQSYGSGRSDPTIWRITEPPPSGNNIKKHIVPINVGTHASDCTAS
jgi:hypothetical protein